MKHVVPFLAAGLLLAPAARAQTRLTAPPLSPATHIRQSFSTSYIDLTYARPSLRGRVAFGNLVPHGVVWRTGANGITKVRFGEEVKINGQAVPAGAYALLTIPDAKEWTFILNRDTAQWGAYEYKPALDVLRAKARPTRLAAPVETMSLTVENLRPDAADLVISWDRTQVALPLTADPDRVVMGQIAQAMQGEKKPYITAAQYYYNTGKDLTPALGWVDEFIKANPSYYGYYWKAKLLQKQGKNPEAIAAATKSLELVQTDKNEVSRAEFGAGGRLLGRRSARRSPSVVGPKSLPPGAGPAPAGSAAGRGFWLRLRTPTAATLPLSDCCRCRFPTEYRPFITPTHPLVPEKRYLS